MISLPYIITKVIVHRDLVESWDFSVKTPSDQFTPCHSIIITEGAALNQVGSIKEIYDNRTALVRMGTNRVSYNHV